MASLSELRAALAEQLTTMTSLQGIYTDEPGQVSPPAAVIRLGSPAITYSTSLAGGSHDYSFTVLVLVGNASTVGQEALDGYLDPSGPDSVYAAVDADPTLGGVADSALVTTVQNAGVVSWAGGEYLGAELLVTVLA
ncbi:MAG TPA: hypothetical protein VFS70_17165 [Actinomycetota bacterium]|nr:hypothetical protein [Actinomycetota bacterium]